MSGGHLDNWVGGRGAILFSHLPIEHGLTFIKGVLMNATAKKAVAATMQSHKAVKQVQLLGCQIFVNLLKDGKYKGGGVGGFYFILLTFVHPSIELYRFLKLLCQLI